MSPETDAFEREKWLTEVELRRRELDLKEREQTNRDAEIELKRREQAASNWRSPLVVAIFAAAVAAGGNAVIAVVNGQLQRDLENSKAESTRILEMIKTGDSEKAAGNLEFLLKAGLITDAERAAKVGEFLKVRTPGGGPSLPAPESRVSFENTGALTESVQASLETLLNDFSAHLDTVGFPAATGKVRIKVERLNFPNAQYHNGTVVIDTRLTNDPSVALREYGHHVLMSTSKSQPWQNQYAAIESAMADYLACSFLDDPRMGAKAAKVFDPSRPYIRLLANDRKFSEFRTMSGPAEMPYVGAEIWGGALWAIRTKLGRNTADPIIATAWLKTVWPADESRRALAFVAALLSAARTAGAAPLAAIEAILRAREFPTAPASADRPPTK